LRLHLLDVGAGGEGLLAAGEDEATLAGVRVIGGEDRGQLGEDGGVQGVQRLRAVERDQSHRALLLDQDGFVICHVVLPRHSSDRWNLVGSYTGREIPACAGMTVPP